MKKPQVHHSQLQRAVTNTIPLGSLVFCDYRDITLFKDSQASEYEPWRRQTVGWLETLNDDFIRIVWEKTPVQVPENSRILSTGLTIPRAVIVELRMIG